MRRIISILFLLSGITGLVYQVLWAKYLALFLGSTAQAHTIVLAVFLGGLALGSIVFGRIADRIGNQLALYGWLEIGVGVLGAASPYLLSSGADMYLYLARDNLLNPTILFLLKLVFSALVLLVPTVLMGGTLPALSRFMTDALGDMERKVSWLYFLNSAGAAFGALIAGFVLIPGLGLDLSTSLVAAGNIVIGLIALLLAKGRAGVLAANQVGPTTEVAEAGGGVSVYHIYIIYFAIFLSGCISLGYEIAWIRLLSLVLGSSTYSFSIMLAAFIAGIALGALLVNRRIFPSVDSYLLFGFAELALALSVLFTLQFYERLPFYFSFYKGMLSDTPAAYNVFLLLKFLFCFCLMLLPTTCLGMTLPLATRAVTNSVSEIGKKVGNVYSANTLGNVIGAILAGLLLLPLLGIQTLIEAGAVLNLLIGLIVVFTAAQTVARTKLTTAFVCIALAALALGYVGSWDKKIITSGAFLKNITLHNISFDKFKHGFGNQDLLYYKDDSNATVSVTKYHGGGTVLKVNGKADASTGRDISTQMLLAQIPLMLKTDAKQVLVVGLGSGITAGSALTHTIDTVDVVEISQGVVEAAQYFNSHNGAALKDPRLNLHVEDAKTFLALTPKLYDVIISEPSNPWIAGIGNLFSVEFYREAKAHLAPGGVMVQWFHSYAIDDELVRLILRTFAASFEHVTLWNTIQNSAVDGDFLLIGSSRPLVPSYSAVEAKLIEPKIAADFARIGIKSLATLMSLQVGTDRGVRAIGGRGHLNADRFPVLEYQAPRALFIGSGAEVLNARDERVKPISSAPLFFTEYLKQRGQPLTAAEYKELAQYHKIFSATSFYARVLHKWRSQDPNAELVLRALLDYYYERGQLQLALGVAEDLLSSEPGNASLHKLIGELKEKWEASQVVLPGD
ncbi:fused MFS/spermidine synthase [Oligoflexia bacterium]|nr:fused MFS/spermidine synthase [Oligoflexia bacterium]